MKGRKAPILCILYRLFTGNSASSTCPLFYELLNVRVVNIGLIITFKGEGETKVKIRGVHLAKNEQSSSAMARGEEEG